MDETEHTPTRIDFGPGIYGLDYETQERYLGEVYSQLWGNGPICIYEKGNKIYRLISGLVDDVPVQGEYFVYELDMRENGLSIAELKNPQVMKGAIEAAKGKITKTPLGIGVDYKIAPGILHQPCGKGVLRIEVPSGYTIDKVIESDEVNLSEYYTESNEE